MKVLRFCWPLSLVIAGMAPGAFAGDAGQDAKPSEEAHDQHARHAGRAGQHDHDHDHAAMGHQPAQPEPKPDAHDSAQSAQPLDHAAMGHGPPPASEHPLTPIPVPTDADRAAAFAPVQGHAMHDTSVQSLALFNRLERFDGDHGHGLEWEGQAWFGTDRNKLWLRSEGEHSGGEFESGDIEVLYGRAFARWWDGLIGVRHDFKPGDSQDFLAIGISGVAPYKFEVQATAYLGQSGQTAARFEVEYETLLTNRWILQPLVEVEFHGQEDVRRGIGAGLSTLEAGLRLRYEFSRRFAPYVGVTRERAFGKTAEIRRAQGEGSDDTRAVVGVRFWF